MKREKLIIVILLITTVLCLISCSSSQTNAAPCANGHTLVIDAGKAATCTETGLTEGTHCSICNTVVTKQEVIPAAHDFTSEITKSPSCTEEGIKTFTCSVCGYKKAEPIAKIPHKYDAGVTTTETTCTSNGIITYTCTVCGATKTAEIKTMGHIPDSNYICTRCGAKCPVKIDMTASDIVSAASVSYLADRSIQYDEDGAFFTLLFSLKDSSETRIQAPAIVEISIVNDNSQTVYSAVKIIKSGDYATWTSLLAGSRLLASVRIDCSDIKPGTSGSGNIYFTVYNSGYFTFEESSLGISSNLPLLATNISIDTLPVTINNYSYNGSLKSSVKITDISYEISGDDVYFYFAGEKTYDTEGSRNSQYCIINWKLYDSDGYVIGNGSVFTPDLAEGEKFRNEKVYAWNCVTPGESYELVLFDD